MAAKFAIIHFMTERRGTESEGSDFLDEEGSEFHFRTPTELDVFIENLARVLFQHSDSKQYLIGFRTLLGNLRGSPKLSQLLHEQASRHRFFGALRDIKVKPTLPDRKVLPRGLQQMPEVGVQSIAVEAQMHSTGRGFIGYERALATLYVPPERYFLRYRSQGSFGVAYRDCGEPLVLITARPVMEQELAASVDLLNTGSELIAVWAQRFALARTVSSGLPEQKPRFKTVFTRSMH